jgi:hypothetical protein
MRKNLRSSGFSSLLILLALPVFCQLLPEEIAERPQWEEFLIGADVVKAEQMIGPESVTSPWHLTLERDGLARDAYWKDVEGRPKGYIEGWKYEIAAYRFDKHLGLHMIPPTVEKRFRENRGSCMLGVPYWKKLDKIKSEKIKAPPRLIVGYNRAIYLQRAFDNLIGNQDRHLNNYLITEDWRIILIDHSRSFRTGKKWTKELIYTEKHREGPMIMRELPRAFYEKIKSLNFEIIEGFVGDYLSDDEINAVLARKDLIIMEIERLVQQNGEDKVLYSPCQKTPGF